MAFKLYEEWVLTYNLCESRVGAHPDKSYIFNLRYQEKIPDIIRQLMFEHDSIDNITMNSKTYLISGAAKIKSISYKEAKDYFDANSNVSILKDNNGLDIFLIVDAESTTLLTQVKESGETSTIVKEGMVILFYYSNITTAPTKDNLSSIIKKLKTVIIPPESLDTRGSDEINKYLDDITNSPKIVGDMIDFWSAGFRLNQSFDVKNYIVLKSGLYDRIRKLGSRVSGYNSDKWCPADLFLVNKTALNVIENFVNEIETNIQEDSLARLNDIFTDEINFISSKDISGSVLGISLKQEKAQGGKAKGFLRTLTKNEKEYNVTPKEIELDDIILINSIETMRQKIKDSCAHSSITVDISRMDSGYPNSTREKIIGKFASLKIAAKLLENPDNIDNNILKATSFALGLTGINPTFYKLIGNRKGKAKVEKFTRGELIFLMRNGLGNKGSKVEIIDTNTSAEIIFKFMIKIGKDEKNVVLKCRPNGQKQSTLEIEKIK